MTTPQLTGTHRTVLRALADAVVPSLDRAHDPTGFWALSGRELQADAAVAQALLELPDEQREGLLVLLEGLHALGFTTESRCVREQLIRDVAVMGAQTAAAMSALVSLTLAVAYAGPDPRTGSNPMWAGFDYPGPPRVEPGGDEPPEPFIPDGAEAVLEADVCIVGSGAGGGLIAGVLAEAGLDVVVLEAGGNFNEPDFDGLELPAFQQLFWRGGPTPTADFNVSLLAGERSAADRPSTGPTACACRSTARAMGNRLRARGRRRS